MADSTVVRAGLLDKNLAKMDVAVRAGLVAGAGFYIAQIHRTFQVANPRGHASGRLIRSIGASKVTVTKGIYSIRVGPAVEYGQYVHDGTGPKAGKGPRKMPPIDAIYGWVKEKGLVSTTYQVTVKQQRRNAKGRYIKGFQFVDVKKKRKAKDVEKDRRALAFLIARKIGRVGTEPFPYMTTPYNLYKDQIKAVIISTVMRTLGRQR